MSAHPHLDQVQSHGFRRLRWLTLGLLTVSIFAVATMPMWLLYPFRHQTLRHLELAYRLRQLGPGAALLAVVLGLPLLAWTWHRARGRLERGAVLLTAALLLAGAWLAPLNVFERMMQPLPDGTYVQAGDVGFLPDADQVLAVTINGDAAAYPVRLIAYHHIVEDVVGGVPVVVTY